MIICVFHTPNCAADALEEAVEIRDPLTLGVVFGPLPCSQFTPTRL
jgi:hypothetical protein